MSTEILDLYKNPDKCLKYIQDNLHSRNMRPYHLAKDAGVSQASLSRFLRREQKTLDTSTIERIIKYFGEPIRHEEDMGQIDDLKQRIADLESKLIQKDILIEKLFSQVESLHEKIIDAKVSAAPKREIGG